MTLPYPYHVARSLRDRIAEVRWRMSSTGGLRLQLLQRRVAEQPCHMWPDRSATGKPEYAR